MKLRFKKWHFLIIICIIIILYLFWGPLFPWNPVKVGFRKYKTTKTTVFISGSNMDSIVYNLDEVILEEEMFHGLLFRKKFKIIIVDKNSSMRRFLPWFKGSGYSIKLGFLNTIYIGANAGKSAYGIEVFLKHEMSHLLLHQNSKSPSTNLEIAKQGWLSEGIATYYGGPSYFNKDEFINIWEGRGMNYNSLYMENPLYMDRGILRLKYTYYRFFIEFLIKEYGLKKFQVYLKNYINDPKSYRKFFTMIYGKELNEILEESSTYMKADKI